MRKGCAGPFLCGEAGVVRGTCAESLEAWIHARKVRKTSCFCTDLTLDLPSRGPSEVDFCAPLSFKMLGFAGSLVFGNMLLPTLLMSTFR